MTTPDIWGPHGWKFLHYVTLNYPIIPSNDDKKNYKEFFNLLQFVLPCSVCSKHFKENLKVLPLSDTVMESRENLIKWCIDMHNIVNKSKNKPELSYDQAIPLINTNIMCKEQFVNIDNQNYNSSYLKDKDNINIVPCLIIIVFILILIAVVYKKK